MSLALALQGGGAHGAFTWGVLDRLLEEPGLRLDAASGASAGAINAVLVAQGLLEGDAGTARRALERFWLGLAALAPPGLVTTAQPGSAQPSPLSRWLQGWARLLAPHELNPLQVDPLRDLLAGLIDFDALRRHSPLKLFVAAADANTGALRVFREDVLGLDMLMASACIPWLRSGVLIDGAPHWDGALAANPPLAPLLWHSGADDILAVLLKPPPLSSPAGAEEIRRHWLELSFQSAFQAEWRALAEMRQRLTGPAAWFSRSARRLQRVRWHDIDSQQALGTLSAESRTVVDRAFFEHLRDAGRREATAWLATQAGAGQRLQRESK